MEARLGVKGRSESKAGARLRARILRRVIKDKKNNK